MGKPGRGGGGGGRWQSPHDEGRGEEAGHGRTPPAAATASRGGRHSGGGGRHGRSGRGRSGRARSEDHPCGRVETAPQRCYLPWGRTCGHPPTLLQ